MKTSRTSKTEKIVTKRNGRKVIVMDPVYAGPTEGELSLPDPEPTMNEIFEADYPAEEDATYGLDVVRSLHGLDENLQPATPIEDTFVADVAAGTVEVASVIDYLAGDENASTAAKVFDVINQQVAEASVIEPAPTAKARKPKAVRLKLTKMERAQKAMDTRIINDARKARAKAAAEKKAAEEKAAAKAAKVQARLDAKAAKIAAQKQRAYEKANVPQAAAEAAGKAIRAGKSPKAFVKAIEQAIETAEKKAPASARETQREKAIGLMQRPEGATIDELMTAMGWQKHTVRGFVAGTVKKLGYAVTSAKNDAGQRTYTIAS